MKHEYFKVNKIVNINGKLGIINQQYNTLTYVIAKWIELLRSFLFLILVFFLMHLLKYRSY